MALRSSQGRVYSVSAKCFYRHGADRLHGLYFSYVCSLFPSWSPDSSQYPAIHIQNLTVNKVTPATGQKNCRTLQIIRIAPLASGCALQNKFIQRIARCSNRCCLLGGK